MYPRVPHHYASSERPTIQFHLSEGALPPTKSYSGDAGWDLYTSKDAVIPAKGHCNVATGVFFALPPGFWAQLIARSSTFRRYGLHIVEAVIDNGYRGELFVQAVNPNAYDITVPKHSRLSQIILHQIHEFKWNQVEELPPTTRGEKGFGSSGV